MEEGLWELEVFWGGSCQSQGHAPVTLSVLRYCSVRCLQVRTEIDDDVMPRVDRGATAFAGTMIYVVADRTTRARLRSTFIAPTTALRHNWRGRFPSTPSNGLTCSTIAVPRNSVRSTTSRPRAPTHDPPLAVPA
eukprot:388645-Prymnesium_polylepis.1